MSTIVADFLTKFTDFTAEDSGHMCNRFSITTFGLI